MLMIGRAKDRTGDIYHPWRVIKLHGKSTRSKKSVVLWECECISCNYRKIIDASRFYPPPICECGVNKKINKCSTTHGMSRSRIYKIWGSMKQRCLNKNHPTYQRYGAKGIKICEEWMGFNKFYNDVGDPPSEIHSIDRKDNLKGYIKGNCRWATPTEQANNRSTNRVIAYNGESLTMSQWARKAGIPKGMLKHRVDSGWPFNKAISEPFMRGSRKYSCKIKK